MLGKSCESLKTIGDVYCELNFCQNIYVVSIDTTNNEKALTPIFPSTAKQQLPKDILQKL